MQPTTTHSAVGENVQERNRQEVIHTNSDTEFQTFVPKYWILNRNPDFYTGACSVVPFRTYDENPDFWLSTLTVNLELIKVVSIKENVCEQSKHNDPDFYTRICKIVPTVCICNCDKNPTKIANLQFIDVV